MITVFNRRELLSTVDMSIQSNVRSILEAKGVHYTVKVTNLQGSRARSGSFGLRQNCSYEYRIYVHKNDYEYALRLIN